MTIPPRDPSAPRAIEIARLRAILEGTEAPRVSIRVRRLGDGEPGWYRDGVIYMGDERVRYLAYWHAFTGENREDLAELGDLPPGAWQTAAGLWVETP